MTETGSTNADLLAAAARGEPEGAVRVTDHQTAGRGRQGRSWQDEPGNSMLMSVLLRPAATVAPLVPLISGLAVTDGVNDLLAGPARSGPVPVRAALKWPNDVLVPELGERKLCGILAEATTAGADPGRLVARPSPGGGRMVVVSGMGMNIRFTSPPPDEIAQRAVTLEELAGRPVDRWDAVAAVLTQFERWLTAAEDAPATVLAAYRARCLTIGRTVRLQTATGVLEGVASAVADSGGLVIETAQGPVTVTAGDAHHI
ncbi:MAG: biotin--[acetyl-CoA-carboxylase] ligase [Acidimicrobiales bacterium]